MTNKIITLLVVLLSVNAFAQKVKPKAPKVTDEFVLADFYNLIHKDTLKNIAAVKNKYFPKSDYYVDGPRKTLCSYHAIYPPLTLMNKNITVDICMYEPDKVYALEVIFNNVNYVNDSLIIKQIRAAKFVKGSFYRLDDMINSEYIRKEDSLYIETKWQKDKIVAIKFK